MKVKKKNKYINLRLKILISSLNLSLNLKQGGNLKVHFLIKNPLQKKK